MTVKLTFIAAAMLMVGSPANSITINFDDYASPTDNDLTNNFSELEFSTGGYFSQQKSGGISGGSIVPGVFGDSNDAVSLDELLPNSEGMIYTATMAFRFDADSVNPLRTNVPLRISFVPGTFGFNNRANAMIETSSAASRVRVNGLLWNSADPLDIPLVDGHWYLLESTIANHGGQFAEIEAAAALFDLGVSGTSAPTEVGATSTVFSDGVYANATQLEIRIFAEQFGGTVALDNFTAEPVPEPSAPLMLACVLSTLCTLRFYGQSWQGQGP